MSRFSIGDASSLPSRPNRSTLLSTCKSVYRDTIRCCHRERQIAVGRSTSTRAMGNGLASRCDSRRRRLGLPALAVRRSFCRPRRSWCQTTKITPCFAKSGGSTHCTAPSPAARSCRERVESARVWAPFRFLLEGISFRAKRSLAATVSLCFTMSKRSTSFMIHRVRAGVKPIQDYRGRIASDTPSGIGGNLFGLTYEKFR